MSGHADVTAKDMCRPLELLSPAKDLQTGITAINHGADAVYIGPQAFGARAAASNSTADIARLCDYAHRFRAKVYVTLNTILYPHELKQAESLIHDLYKAGADALIVQDMGILRLDLPPIQLHASTQCDTRTPDKAVFLQNAGFSQIVLARELTTAQIRGITEQISVPAEVFIHGALCVSYSGRCHASWAACGRSANRGECAQMCRLPYTLIQADGTTLGKQGHLLSLKDLNTTPVLEDLIEAGASSFKIEGRLKNPGYVANITAHYRRLLDRIISDNPDKYCRASFGVEGFAFTPCPEKSFNRGFTTYFMESRQAARLTNPLTPKSMGEPITDLSSVKAGDGISYISKSGEYVGARVNKTINGKPVLAKGARLPMGVPLFRTSDFAFNKVLDNGNTAQRKIAVDISVYPNRIVAEDERGIRVVLPLPPSVDKARKPLFLRPFLEKLGDTVYTLRNYSQHLDADYFIPASQITSLRRDLVTALDRNNRATYLRPLRTRENMDAKYPCDTLTFADNVANPLAEQFYRQHGVKHIEPALETAARTEIVPGTLLMTTRFCLLRELGCCKKDKATQCKLMEPLTLRTNSGTEFTVRTDCQACEMQILKK